MKQGGEEKRELRMFFCPRKVVVAALCTVDRERVSRRLASLAFTTQSSCLSRPDKCAFSQDNHFNKYRKSYALKFSRHCTSASTLYISS